MDTDVIDQRIKRLESEQAILMQSHETTVARYQELQRKFQEAISQNQVRFQQIKGGIAELTALKEQNGKEPI